MTQTYKVQVSMNQAHLVESGIVWKQGDFGFNLEIEVLDFDTTGVTPQIVFRKSAGAVEATEITQSSNKFTYVIRGTELDTPGPCICDLKLMDSTTKRVSTASFKYFVIPDTMDGLNEQASSYSDTIAQIITEYEVDVHRLDRIENDTVKLYGRNLWDEYWEYGSLSNTTGENTDNQSTNTIRSKGYIKYPGGRIYVCSPVDLWICFYDSSKTFISASRITKGTDFAPASGTAYMRFRTTGTVTEYENNICLNVTDAYDGTYTPSEFTAIDKNKQPILTWDNVPAQNSTNAVSSGTVYKFLGDNLAPDYDTSKDYSIGDLVFYNGLFYECITATTAGTFAALYWKNVTISEIIAKYNADLRRITDDISATFGRNLWNEEWEYGSISESTGANITGTNTIRSKGYIKYPGGRIYVCSPVDLWICFYDSSKTFISASRITKGTDFAPASGTAYMRFRTTGTVAEYENNICLNVTDAYDGTYTLSEFTAIDKYLRNKNSIDSDMTAAVQAMISHNRTGRYLNFLFITDTHENEVKSKPNIDRFVALSKTNMFRAAIHGGDYLTTDDNTYSIAEFVALEMKYINDFTEAKNLIMVQGNHDINHTGDADTNLNKYQYHIMFENNIPDAVHDSGNPTGNYFYIDYEDSKVRVAFLDSFSDTGTEVISTSQVTWLTDTVFNLQNGWRVLIITHYFDLEKQGYANAKTAFASFQTAHPDQFIGIIHGHRHEDRYVNTDGYNIIGVTSGEKGFDIFTIDTDNQKIYEIRIGTGSSREYTYGSNANIVT